MALKTLSQRIEPALALVHAIGKRPEFLHGSGELAQIGVAIANRQANITLSANAGYAANVLSQRFGPGNSHWSLAASLTQPIFEKGTLLHRERAARAAYDEALARYRSTVITAFQKRCRRLCALHSDAKALTAAVAAERAAATTLNRTQRQLELAQAAYLLFINAKQAYQ